MFYNTPFRLWRYIYDQTYNLSFHQKLESIQYNAALALIEGIIDS